MIHALLFALASNAFAIPRVDFDLHPGTMAFIIFCIALVGGLFAAMIVLGISAGQASRDETPASANAAASDAEDEVASFIPDEATPNLAVAEKELTSVGSWAEDQADRGDADTSKSRLASEDQTEH